MYNRKIKIVILSKDTSLENILLKAAWPDELFISFITTPTIDQIDVKTIDILIYDGLDSISKAALKANSKLLTVLCVNQLQLSALTASLKNNLEDIWLNPFDSNLIQFQFQRLVERLILKRKYDLGQNCLNVLINNVPDLIWFKSRDGTHVIVNDEFCYTAGKSRQKIEGHNHYQIWNIDKETYEKSEYVCLDTDSIIIESKKPGVFDEKVEGKHGMRQLRTYKSPIFDDCGEFIGTVGVAHDVTIERKYQAQLERLAYTDQLTGLFTRHYLYQYVEQNMDNANLTLLYIDMDNFKLINDTYGHLWGDEVLKITGKILQNIFPDDICVRMGGDEFIIAITDKSNLTELEEKVNSTIETVRTCFSILPDAHQLSLSIGIATKENHPIELDELLKRSDTALYKAKSKGKNQYVVYTHEYNERKK